MAKHLVISADLTLPLNVATQAIAVFGIRGAGKTNTAGVMAEELLKAGVPVAIIDPTDAWWGLRSSRDGQREGFAVFIFGGSHGDLPLEERDGKVIAEFVVSEQVPVILSLRHLRKGAQRRFVTEFCEELYHLKGRSEHRSPLTVFIDEAPAFVPQKVTGDVARTVGAVEDLVARGRNAGFGVVLIAQRPATLNADVRSLCDTIITHRITGPLDRKAFAAWIEENASVAEMDSVLTSLAKLKDGEAWVWAPVLDIMQRVQIRLRESFDSSKTPKLGENIRPPKKLAEIDREKLKGRLNASIEKARADDPKELRKQIADLKRDLAKAATAPVPKASTESREVRAEWAPLLKERDGVIRELQGKLSRIAKWLGKAHAAHEEIAGEVARELPKLTAPPELPRQVFNITPGPVAMPARPRVASGSSAGNGDSSLGKGERAILAVLAHYPHGKNRRALGTLSGYSASGGSFGTYISRLRGKGCIDGTDPIRITDKGLAELGAFDPLPRGEELQSYWLARLGKGEAAILRVLLGRYPDVLSRDELGHLSGYEASGGSFGTYLSRLRTKELIDYRELRASEAFFE